MGQGSPSEGSSPRPPIVTLDGPAGSGKSSTARAVARRLGFRHLDSGALYRALTWALLADGVSPETWGELTPSTLGRYSIRLQPASDEHLEVSLQGRVLEDELLRGPEVTRHVSLLSSLPSVRVWLIDRQREVGRGGGLVAEGRDMGTVVFPDAEVKIYLTAELRERALRRLREKGVAAPDEPEIRAEAERIRGRDATDSERQLSPLRPAEDAQVLDTTHLDFETQVETIVRGVRERLGPSPNLD